MVDMILLLAAAATEEEYDISIMVIVKNADRRIYGRYDEDNADELILCIVFLVTSTSEASLNLV
jgi:hypothetical protein